LKAGQTITAYDTIMGLITCSANDGAVVLAEALAGDAHQFADMMTRQARALGMQNTVFKNPNGLPDPNQITTARDMAMLGYGLVSHFPGFYSYFSKNNFTYRGRSYNNHNNLMKRYDGMDGIKTGYIRASGFNLVTSAVRGDTRLIGVMFGGRSAASRYNAMEKLLDTAFTDFHQSNHMNLATLSLPSKTAAIFGGTKTAEPAPSKPTLSAASRSQRPRLTMTPAAPMPPSPPTAPGSLGTLSLNEQELGESAGAWGIQVGSYSSVETAQKAIASLAKNMVKTLGDAEPSLQKITMTDGSAMYRARFIGLDKTSARSACSQVIRRGQGCLVVMEP
ncbi:MAG TPA: D-alanyl-D-alanine carboxypeptidase, partial [Rhodospirillaceae bacterium]|nr:D-alanyl-D-alanine carboxypeptidase [Rhodospirillaceae bacterium]